MNEILDSIRRIQLSEWHDFKNVLDGRPNVTKYDNPEVAHYGTTIYCFHQADIIKLFNYEFVDFMARIIMSDESLHYHLINGNNLDQLKIFDKWNGLKNYVLTHEDNINDLIPGSSGKSKSFVCGYGYAEDGNDTYAFVNDSERFIYYHSWGS